MSKENQNRENQDEKVDYRDLFNSLVRRSEQKEKKAEKKEEPKRKGVTSLFEKREAQPPAPKEPKAKKEPKPPKPPEKPKVQREQKEKKEEMPVQNVNHVHYVPAEHTAAVHVPQKKGRFYQSLCPYCGKKVGLFRTWMLKNKGDYFCTECGNRSAVVIDKIVLPMAAAAAAVSLILILIFTFLVDMHIWSIVLIFIPFLIFFCASVFLVRLKKIAPPGAKRKKKPVQEDMQNTRVI